MTFVPPPDFFRHEFARLVAILSRRWGERHLEAVEDAVQSALAAALETWPRMDAPANPSAWLFRAANNNLVTALRAQTRRSNLADRFGVHAEVTQPESEPGVLLQGDLPDALLRMLFVCCNPVNPVEGQLVLALKILCGFSVAEIAQRFFIGEETVYKRLARARARLRKVGLGADELTPDLVRERMPSVHAVLYTLFTEGHLSWSDAQAIRLELCDEALRLTRILAEHPLGSDSESAALLALMYLHRARMGARVDSGGGLLLLAEQDRARWDATHIQRGLEWLARSAQGDLFSRFHAEAGIAAEHCLAPSLAETRWERIVEGYAMLDRIAPSALNTLNRALAVAEWQGPQSGLEVLAGLEPPSWLAGSFLWAAVLADLHRRCGHVNEAAAYRKIALEVAPSDAVREALTRRLQPA